MRHNVSTFVCLSVKQLVCLRVNLGASIYVKLDVKYFVRVAPARQCVPPYVKWGAKLGVRFPVLLGVRPELAKEHHVNYLVSPCVNLHARAVVN